MPLVNVGRAADLPPGKVMEVFVGQRPYAICNFEGALYALDGVCLHEGGPLGQGQLDGPRLVCPYHFWEFDCRTGEYELDPAIRVATYPVRIEDGQILLEAP
ncbi:MAG: Rieske 2Fe-2S domain-containing protein [Bryobacteraceae bacterium]